MPNTRRNPTPARTAAIGLDVPIDMKDELIRLAERNDLSVSQIIRRAICLYLRTSPEYAASKQR